MELTINDMTCNHCVSTITKTIQALDANAVVEADLQTHKVKVQTSVAEDKVRQALSNVGFDAA